MYTSGSTGKPKGVAIRQQGVIRLVSQPNYVDIAPGDTIAQISNAAFDASTFEIWGALINGARLVILPRETVLSPTQLACALQSHQVTTMFLTTALFNRVSAEQPDAFSTLRNVLFGGEACDPDRVRAVMKAGPPARLVHVYGPTETTTFATYHVVREAGRPRDDSDRPAHQRNASAAARQPRPTGSSWRGRRDPHRRTWPRSGLRRAPRRNVGALHRSSVRAKQRRQTVPNGRLCALAARWVHRVPGAPRRPGQDPRLSHRDCRSECRAGDCTRMSVDAT